MIITNTNPQNNDLHVEFYIRTVVGVPLPRNATDAAVGQGIGEVANALGVSQDQVNRGLTKSH